MIRIIMTMLACSLFGAAFASMVFGVYGLLALAVDELYMPQWEALISLAAMSSATFAILGWMFALDRYL